LIHIKILIYVVRLKINRRIASMNHLNFKTLLLLALTGVPPLGFMLGVSGVVNAKWYVLFVLLPSFALAVFLALKSRKQDPELYRKIVLSFWIGILGTFALDIFRIGGIMAQIVPMDEAVEVGSVIVGGPMDHTSDSPMNKDEMGGHGEGHGSEKDAMDEPNDGAGHGEMDPGMAAKIIGYGYHYLNGISFALAFLLIFGKLTKYMIGNAVIFGVIIWILMWTLPPMPAMAGYFGLKTGGIGLALITLVAHIAFGFVIGFLAKRNIQATVKTANANN
jgi:hypothetical protein